MDLYGSTTSPFVRRIRLWLEPKKYNFKTLDIFNSAQRDSFKAMSPILKIPVLKDDHQIIYDSRVIFRYLSSKNGKNTWTWDQENLLTILDDWAQSLVTLLLCRRSQIPVLANGPFGVSHLDRIKNSLDFLETQVQRGNFDRWDFLTMSLYSYADWILFRDITPIAADSPIIKVLNRFKDEALVRETDPRNT